MDAFRRKDTVALWIKTKDGDISIERRFAAVIYAETSLESYLKRNGLDFEIVKRLTYTREYKQVCEVPIFDLGRFEQAIRLIEKSTRHRVALYDADITPEQQFLYKNHLVPGCEIEVIGDDIRKTEGRSEIALKRCNIDIVFKEKAAAIYEIRLNEEIFAGEEAEFLKSFTDAFMKLDPDVILMEHAFSKLPVLYDRLERHGISCPFHRWDALPIKYKGGKAFFSYGKVAYHDFAIRLKGRFLVDTSATIGGDCDVDGIMELCRLTGAQFQQVASRSFGAAFQLSLVRLMHQNNYLVPYKEKPVDIPLSMLDMLKGDRGGHTFDAKVGFHKDVAEIDFTSMFPWIIYNKNISAESILLDEEPLEKVPNLPFSISHKHKGLVPLAIKPILDARMQYKKNPTSVNKARADALKYVLVTAYGYLRFREFKLGIASSHMAICSYAREMILESARLAEQRGFKVLHGIIDSLYIQKKGIDEDEVRAFCKELEQVFGIPASFEGIFRWIVFLPSVNDPKRPLPATYYGLFDNGSIKARGIDVRQRKSPLIVRMFQQKILEEMSLCSTAKHIAERAASYYAILRDYADSIPNLGAKYLEHRVVTSKSNYTSDIPQRRIIARLKKKGVMILPGQRIRYVMQNAGAVLPEEYAGRPDMGYYRKLLTRSLFVLLQPFGITIEAIKELSSYERQTKLHDFFSRVKHVYVPCARFAENCRGLSEKRIKSRLKRDGWEVWRGGIIGIENEPEIYPNIKKRYERLSLLLNEHCHDNFDLLRYLCAVHHGMPDYICFRNGRFKFVECKLKHEQLSKRQRSCIKRLKDAGLDVEVHKLVDPATTAREADIDLMTKEKNVISKQMKLKHTR